MKIGKLTKEQINKFPAYVDKWLNIGLCTDTIDFEKSKEAVCLAYECVGLEKNRRLIHERK